MTASAQQNDCFKAQQQYWDTWFDQQRKFLGVNSEAPAGFQQPWAEFFKTWQSTISGDPKTADTAAFSNYFTQAGQTYLNMMQQFYQATGQAKPVEQMTHDWLETMQKTFAGAFTSGKDPFTMMDPMNFFASIPGIGYTREKQEQLNALYQQWAEYEARNREYTAAMAKVALEAVQKFQEYLANPPKDAAPLKSLKEVYVKWVDICEVIYARYAMSEEYTRLYGEVVNALMAFKKKQNEVFDDILEQMNMPTRREVDSLHERLHALRREVLALKSELKGKTKPATAAPAQKTTGKGKKK